MIEIYIKSTCPYCISAKNLLDSKEQPYQTYEITQEPELKAKMIQRANGHGSVPQIFIKNKHIGGCDDLYILDSQGKLDALLK